MTNQEQSKIVDLLFAKYSKIMLSKRETSAVTGLSISTLDRLRRDGLGIEYIQPTDTSNVYYSIHSISEYLVRNKILTA